VLVVGAPASGAPIARIASSGSADGVPQPPSAPRARPSVPDLVPAAPPPGTTTLVSAARTKGFAAGPSSTSSISENGRWVAFASSAPDIVAGDTNNAQDVFVRDRSKGTTVRLPLPNGRFIPAKASAADPAISADASAVAFTYTPPPPPAGTVVACALPIVLLWHRDTGASEVASIAHNERVCGATAPSLSGDGRLLAFLGPEFNDSGAQVTQVLVRDMGAGTTSLVSVDSSGEPGATHSRAPAISSDGRVVAFESDSSNFAKGDTNESSDVFVRVLPDGPTEWISRAPGGPGNGPSLAAAISADGNKVAFESGAQNLIAGLTPGAREVYVRDRSTGELVLASTSTDGTPAKGTSGQAAISSDGRVVAFASVTADLAMSGNAILAATAIPPTEVYARDLGSGETIRISEARGGGPAGQFNALPTIGGSGRFVAFASNSPNLVRGDGNQVSDVFLRDLPPAPTIAPDPVDFGARALGAPGPPIAAVVTNAGWSPLSVGGVDRAGPAAADFSIVFNGCDGRVIRRGESCPITITFAPGGAGERVATLAVDHNGLRSPATATLHGSSSNAKIEIKPPVGRPGIVVIVTGSGFPPDSQLTLAWSKGITPKLPPIITDARGAFRVQVLVFHNDVIGVRDLVVAPARGASFPPMGSTFLVTEPPSAPPRFEPGDPAANRPPTLIYRR
jgi:Tol biopolymer transport system component